MGRGASGDFAISESPGTPTGSGRSRRSRGRFCITKVLGSSDMTSTTLDLEEIEKQAAIMYSTVDL